MKNCSDCIGFVVCPRSEADEVRIKVMVEGQAGLEAFAQEHGVVAGGSIGAGIMVAYCLEDLEDPLVFTHRFYACAYLAIRTRLLTLFSAALIEAIKPYPLANQVLQVLLPRVVPLYERSLMGSFFTEMAKVEPLPKSLPSLYRNVLRSESMIDGVVQCRYLSMDEVHKACADCKTPEERLKVMQDMTFVCQCPDCRAKRGEPPIPGTGGHSVDLKAMPVVGGMQ